MLSFVNIKSVRTRASRWSSLTSLHTNPATASVGPRKHKRSVVMCGAGEEWTEVLKPAVLALGFKLTVAVTLLFKLLLQFFKNFHIISKCQIRPQYFPLFSRNLEAIQHYQSTNM